MQTSVELCDWRRYKPGSAMNGRRSRTIEHYKGLPKLIERTKTRHNNILGLSEIIANGITIDSSGNYKQLFSSIQPQSCHSYQSQPIQSTQIRSLFKKKKSKCLYGFTTLQNKRSYNEDRVVCIPLLEKPFIMGKECKNWGVWRYFAVFDGHGGAACAQFLKENLHLYVMREKDFQENTKMALMRSFEKIERKFIESSYKQDRIIEKSGACAIVCLIGEKKTFIASVGDCHAIALLKPTSTTPSCTLQDINIDHKPSNRKQYQRVIANGGKVIQMRKLSGRSFGRTGYVWDRHTRIQPGNLNMTRAIGDVEAKLKRFGGLPNVISAEPDVYEMETQGIQYIVLGSDGLFDGVTKEMIHKVYQTMDREEMEFPEVFTKKICELACKQSSDNVSSILIIP